MDGTSFPLQVEPTLAITVVVSVAMIVFVAFMLYLTFGLEQVDDDANAS